MIRSIRSAFVAIHLGTAALASSVAFAPVAHADVVSDSTEALKLAHKKIIAGSQSDVDAEFAKLIDIDTMAREALGSHWDGESEGDAHISRTPEERKEFTDLLRKLIERNYKKRISDVGRYEIIYKGGERQGEKVIVHTEVKDKSDARAVAPLVDYVVVARNNRIAVVNVITEGSSMVHTYQKEFNKVIKKEHFSGLLRKMREKLAKS